MPGPDQRLKGVVVVTAEMVMIAIRGHQQVLQPHEPFPVIRQHVLELFPERLEVIRERMSEWTRARTNKTQHDLLVGGRQGARGWARSAFGQRCHNCDELGARGVRHRRTSERVYTHAVTDLGEVPIEVKRCSSSAVGLEAPSCEDVLHDICQLGNAVWAHHAKAEPRRPAEREKEDKRLWTDLESPRRSRQEVDSLRQ